MLCKEIVSLQHKVGKNMEKVNSIKYYCIIFRILIDGFQKERRMLRPVHRRTNMVADMISIIPAFLIIPGIDTGYAVLICIARLMCIHKAVLCPIAKHGYKSEQ